MSYFKKLCLALVLLCQNFCEIKAQLNAADSALFNNVYTVNLYVDAIYPGNWYIDSPISSLANHYAMMDNHFHYRTTDLDSLSSLTVAANLVEDTIINNSFNLYPFIMNQVNPLVHLSYSFLNYNNNAYFYKYTDTNQSHCKYAFLMVPGSGQDVAIDMMRGYSYHNAICFVKNTCLHYGDVYGFIKPNHECNSFYWNNKKMYDEYLISYLKDSNKHYGINYIVDLVAMIKYLKQHYDKVFLLGLSEGGYSSLLTTMYIQPDAALIGSGYSICFDSSAVEKDILKTRFSYLLDTFDRVKVKTTIANSSTNYLFSYGDGDPVECLDPEHDYHLTENYFSGLSNCTFFYDFNDHCFPPCNAIDTFIQKNIAIPLAHFFVTDTTSADTLYTRVRFCNSGNFKFDLYRDNSLVMNYANITDSVDIALVDSGKYYLLNIADANNVSGKCRDTVLFNKQPIPNGVLNFHQGKNINFVFNNPFTNELIIRNTGRYQASYTVSIVDIHGRNIFMNNFNENKISIETNAWSGGVYFLQIRDGAKRNCYFKILKQ